MVHKLEISRMIRALQGIPNFEVFSSSERAPLLLQYFTDDDVIIKGFRYNCRELRYFTDEFQKDERIEIVGKR